MDCEQGTDETSKKEPEELSSTEIKLKELGLSIKLKQYFEFNPESKIDEVPLNVSKAFEYHDYGNKNQFKLCNEQIKGDGLVSAWEKFLREIATLKKKKYKANSQMPGVINSINHISFTLLTDISFYGNKIRSLQKFSKISLPHLKTLRLDENLLTSLRSLRKCSFPSLQQIDLQSNAFCDPECLVEMIAPVLTVVRLEDWTNSECRTDSKCWFAKLQTPSLNYIRCPNSHRIRQSALDDMLKNKYQRLNVMRCNSTQ